LNALAAAAGRAVGGGALSGLARVYGTIFVQYLAPYVAGSVGGAATAFGTQLTKEYLQWALGSDPIEFQDAAGRIAVATFGGFVAGGLVAKIQQAVSIPTSTNLSVVKTVRIPSFPYFTEIVIEMPVLIDVAVVNTAAGVVLGTRLFAKAFLNVLQESLFPDLFGGQ